MCRGKPRTMMAGRWQKNFMEGTSGNKVDELLQVSSLQRLARERIVEMEVRKGLSKSEAESAGALSRH